MNVGTITKVDALLSLRLGAKWTLRGEELEWLDTVQTQPTEEEIQTEIARLQVDYIAKEYQRKRQAEYPPMTDYLDGIAKGDQAQINKYIADCQAVKSRYPKP
jgi:hypothetical protein